MASCSIRHEPHHSRLMRFVPHHILHFSIFRCPNMISSIALDLGTTSIKAGLLNSERTLTNVVSHAAPTITANGGHYESDALAYVQTAERVLDECLQRTGGALPLGLCSQRSSFLIWERTSGLPLT